MQLTDEALLARLVAFDSTSHRSNLDLADFISEYVDRPGVRVARNHSADGRKVNLVVTAGPADADRGGLLLSGHMDVVPPGGGWESDPFKLVRARDRYVARGACDMKGFVALALNRFVDRASKPLRRPLSLVFTYDEELGTLGARRLAETWNASAPLPRSAIIGEPTSLAVARMHKGHLKVRVTLSGESAHSGYPHLGRNAIEPAGPVLVALAALRAEMAAERPAYGEFFGKVPFPSLSVGTIVGGTALNVVPERCVIELGIRLLPGMSSDEAVERVRATVAAVADAVVEGIGDSPPMVLAETAPVYRTLACHLGQHETRAVSFATDASWLQRLGLDCAIWGPGSIEVAHKPNEGLPVAEFVRAGELLDTLVWEST
ncbi:MAG TPA: acetylornithine deacetylase [Gemmatimonadales bacterium]|nr:acetylornithine deacetylase [Gemmatimonadales bacterium]